MKKSKETKDQKKDVSRERKLKIEKPSGEQP
jgi:hypothetical protein